MFIVTNVIHAVQPLGATVADAPMLDEVSAARGPDAPPSSNTGALNTQVRIDWLEFTCPVEKFDTLFQWCSRFGLEKCDHGMMGYDSSAIFAGSGRLLWCANEERAQTQGVHVSMPSKCLDYLLVFDYNSTRLLSTAFLFGGTVTRLDIAYDDKPEVGQVGLLDLGVIRAAIDADEYVARFRIVSETRTIKGGRGATLYFGSGQSDTRLRIYDKAAEQSLAFDVHWLRVEIQLRRERAHALFLLLCGEDCVEDFDLGAVLLAVLDFKQPSDDPNKSRWVTAGWWSAFVQSASKIRLSKGRVIEESVEHSLLWLKSQVAPTLAFLTSVYQGDTDYLTGLMIEGLTRLSKSKRAIIAASLAASAVVSS